MGDELTTSRVASIRRSQILLLTVITLVLRAASAIDDRRSVRLGHVVGEREVSLVIALVATSVLGASVASSSTRRELGRSE